MKRVTTMLSAFAVVLALALPSWAQVKELPKQTVTVAGTVETIDKNKRLFKSRRPTASSSPSTCPRAPSASTSSRWGTR